MEQDAWAREFIDSDPEEVLAEQEQEKYPFHMKREPHSKTRTLIDEETGFRYEYWDLSMVRNAKPESKIQEKVFLDPIPHVVKDQNVPLRGWYKSKFEPPNVRPRPCFTDAILTQPYGGYCRVGCLFCYINHGYRGWRGQGLAVVDPSYPDKVARQLKRMRSSAAGYFSSFTDPFLPLEDHYHNTQRAASAFVAEGLPIFFLSRLHYPDWAIDLLRKNSYSYAQMSINTSNADAWHRLSPRAISLPEMYEQVHRLSDAGIYVSIQVNPIIPGAVPNEDVLRLIYDLATLGADHLIFKFVEISYPAASSLINQVRSRFGPEAGGRFESLFNCNIGGQRTIDEEYRKGSLDLFAAACREAGVTMATCYEYEHERDAEGKILSKTGISLGRKYITSEQCHGHRVPMFTRPSKGAPFEAVEECPPTGCLYCAEDNEGSPRCGSDLFGKAKALRPSDLRQPVQLTVD